MKDDDMMWQFLREFFNYEHYPIAIEKIQRAKAANPTYRKKWEQIRYIILNGYWGFHRVDARTEGKAMFQSHRTVRRDCRWQGGF